MAFNLPFLDQLMQSGQSAGISEDQLRNILQQLPGPISGYGGGTWNLDGSASTPVEQASPPNFMQQAEAPLPQALGGSGMVSGTPQAPGRLPETSSAEAPRSRRSFLDTVGRISDVLAKVGGAEALYQPTLDANTARMQKVDLDTMQKQLLQQQVLAGGLGIEDTQRARLGQALGGLAGIPADQIASVWPQLAQQAGIAPDKAAQLGQLFQQNPAMVGSLAKSFGYKTEQQGSLPASIQNYAMYQRILAEQGEDAANQFMRFAQPEMEVIKPYQQAQLSMDEREFRRQQIKDRREDRRAERELGLKEAKAEAGGADLTPTQRGTVRQKLQLLPEINKQVARVKQLAGEMSRDGTFARGAVGGLLPGAVAGGKAEQFDKAMGLLRKSILTLTRVPGVGSMSDYESRLDEQAIPSRWGSDAGRTESLQNLESLIGSLQSGYKEMLGSTGGGRTITPRTGRGGASNTPKVGTVQQGYRFKGGNPADRNNWVKQ